MEQQVQLPARCWPAAWCCGADGDGRMLERWRVLLVLGALCLGLTGCGLSINGGAGGGSGATAERRTGNLHDHGRGGRAGGVAQRDAEPHGRIRETSAGSKARIRWTGRRRETAELPPRAASPSLYRGRRRISFVQPLVIQLARAQREDLRFYPVSNRLRSRLEEQIETICV